MSDKAVSCLKEHQTGHLNFEFKSVLICPTGSQQMIVMSFQCLANSVTKKLSFELLLVKCSQARMLSGR